MKRKMIFGCVIVLVLFCTVAVVIIKFRRSSMSKDPIPVFYTAEYDVKTHLDMTIKDYCGSSGKKELYPYEGYKALIDKQEDRFFNSPISRYESNNGNDKTVQIVIDKMKQLTETGYFSKLSDQEKYEKISGVAEKLAQTGLGNRDPLVELDEPNVNTKVSVIEDSISIHDDCVSFQTDNGYIFNCMVNGDEITIKLGLEEK